MYLKKIIHLLSVLSITFCASSCANVKQKEENIKRLEEGGLALVVGGCKNDYKGYGLAIFIPIEQDHQESCSIKWQSESGEVFFINNYIDSQFVKPGTYEFVALHSKDGLGRIAYKKAHNKALSVLNKISIKSGDIIYIGHFDIDTRESEMLLHAMKISNKKNLADDYLKLKYPQLINKFKINLASFSEQATQIKLLFFNNILKKGK